VLIPRPETEHLVESAIKLSKEFPNPAIVDIGTGSGIIAISLKKELPHATIHASDLSERALAIAKQNAAALLDGDNAITFHHGDLFAPLSDLTFDLIVSNPPYITANDYDGLAREVKDHEPKLALYAGEKGLDVYRRLITDAFIHLNPGGYMLVEIGYGQKEDVTAIFLESGFDIHEVIPDYAGIDRVVVAFRNHL
jgi:release factor glutamine methyltransferase